MLFSRPEQTVNRNCSTQTARMTHTSLKVCCLFAVVAGLCDENSRCSVTRGNPSTHKARLGLLTPRLSLQRCTMLSPGTLLREEACKTVKSHNALSLSFFLCSLLHTLQQTTEQTQQDASHSPCPLFQSKAPCEYTQKPSGPGEHSPPGNLHFVPPTQRVQKMCHFQQSD